MKRNAVDRMAFPIILFAVSLNFAGVARISAQTVDIRVFATTDIHGNFMNYDYFSDMPAESYGLVKIAGAIARERAKNPNVLLFDDGDCLQGNPFGDYVASRVLKDGEANVIVRLLDAMRYDAVALGNHEFNFGLEYLDAAIAEARFPVLCANVVKAGTAEPRFAPWTILERNFPGRARRRATDQDRGHRTRAAAARALGRRVAPRQGGDLGHVRDRRPVRSGDEARRSGHDRMP